MIVIMSFINALANIFWTMKLKSIQTHGEEVRSLREVIAMKDDVIKGKNEEIERLKDEHHNVLVKQLFKPKHH